MSSAQLSSDFKKNIQHIDKTFSLPDNYGIVRRECRLLQQKAVIYFADGLCDMDALTHVLSLSFSMGAEDPMPCTKQQVLSALMPYGETDSVSDLDTLCSGVLTGCFLLLCAGFPLEGLLIKARKIPNRSLEEPQHDKVLRGAHLGFGETLPRNAALLRKQLPDPRLMMKSFQIGDLTRTTVLLCYVKGEADTDYLSHVEKKLSEVHTDTLNLGIQSLAECLVKKKVWNPFPRFRYTERPDAAAASLAEGSVLILCDNTPQAMILPVSIFSFLQETNDFYMSPFTGSYLRIIRFLTLFMSVYLTPVWYTLVKDPAAIPSALSFLAVKEPAAVPLLLQLLLIEFALDGLKIASMNTPDALSNSLSVIGGLILGDFAIEVGWFSSESILYMAVVGIAHFAQHNYELSYALKYVRIVMLLFCAVFGWWGILCGTLLLLFLLVTVPTVEEKRRYFYPLLPFHGPALFSLFFRRRKLR